MKLKKNYKLIIRRKKNGVKEIDKILNLKYEKKNTINNFLSFKNYKSIVSIYLKKKL